MKIIARFSAKHQPVAQHIMFVTRAEHSHVEFELPNGRTIGCEIIGGVQERDLNEIQKHVRRFLIEVDDNFVDRLRADIGAIKYDYLRLVTWPFVIKHRDYSKMVCSEYFLFRMAEIFPKLFSERLQLVTPGELLIAIMDRFEEV